MVYSTFNNDGGVYLESWNANMTCPEEERKMERAAAAISPSLHIVRVFSMENKAIAKKFAYSQAEAQEMIDELLKAPGAARGVATFHDRYLSLNRIAFIKFNPDMPEKAVPQPGEKWECIYYDITNRNIGRSTYHTDRKSKECRGKKADAYYQVIVRKSANGGEQIVQQDICPSYDMNRFLKESIALLNKKEAHKQIAYQGLRFKFRQ